MRLTFNVDVDPADILSRIIYRMIRNIVVDVTCRASVPSCVIRDCLLSEKGARAIRIWEGTIL